MHHGRPLILLALLGAGCYANKADTGSGPMSGSGLPIPDGGAPAGDAAETPGADGAVMGDGGRAGDLAADAAPHPQVMAYAQFLDDQWRAWSARWTACFNTAPEALSLGTSPVFDDYADQHAFALEHGLLVLDQLEAQSCLIALKTMSCEWLAGEGFRAACAAALMGTVVSGGACVSPHDCRSPREECAMKEMHGCTHRCTPQPARAALGQSCADRPCVAGATCQLAGAESLCQPLGAVGESCPDRLSCASGAFCQPAAAGADPGTCRTLAAGTPCQGSWQCHYAHACLIPAGATAGTCQPGRKKGEACALHGIDAAGGPYSDCANSLFCAPDAARQFRCVAGLEPGEACGEIDVGGPVPLVVPCRLGSCRPDAAGRKICQPNLKAGAACASELPCEGGLVCIEGKCIDPVVKLGERCTSDGTFACPRGARCALSPVSPTQGTCVRWKAIGEACGDPDDCERGAACTGGICVGCK